MPPRKKVKGTKPKETMRQRQRRLLREQRAKAASNRVKQKALPPIGESGGSKPPKGTKQPGTTRDKKLPHRVRAATRRAVASRGERTVPTSTSSRVRTAGGKTPPPPTYGQVVRKTAANLGRGALRIGRQILKAGITGLVGRDDGSGSALTSAMIANDAINAARGSTAKERNKPQQMGPPTPKYRKSNYKTAEQFKNDPKYKRVKRKK